MDLLKHELGTLESAVHNVAMSTHTQIIIIVLMCMYHAHVTLGKPKLALLLNISIRVRSLMYATPTFITEVLHHVTLVQGQ